MGKSFSGCEIVELAIQVEKNGKDFFTELAEKSQHHEAKEVFLCFASEDEKHIEIFQNIFSSSCSYEPEGSYPEEYFSYMNSLAKSFVFTQENKGTEIAKQVKSDEDAIRVGIKYIKDAILFFEGIKKLVPEKDLSLIDQLIEEEQKHFKGLCDLKKGICDSV